MDNALRRLALLFALTLPCHAQGILAPILFGTSVAPASFTNPLFINAASNMVGTGSGPTVSITYTCASTSDRLILIGDTGSGGISLALSDMAGQAAGATAGPSGTWAHVSDIYASWNMGCASGSNTITLTESSGIGAMIFELLEYAGIGTGFDGSGGTCSSASAVTSCSTSGTASDSGDLAVAYLGTGSGNCYGFASGFAWRNLTTVGGWNSNGCSVQSYGIPFDNLQNASGTITFNPTFASNTPRVLLLNIPGTAVGSGNSFYPTLRQSAPGWGNGSTIGGAFPLSVLSGSTIVVAFQGSYGASSTGVTGTKGEVFTQATSLTRGGNPTTIYTGVTTGSGTDTITISGTSFATNAPSYQINEFTGLTGTVTDTGGINTGSAPMSWTQTISNNNSVVYAACGDQSGGVLSGPSYGSGYSYTSFAEEPANSMNGIWGRFESSGSTTPSVPLTANNADVCVSIVLQ